MARITPEMAQQMLERFQRGATTLGEERARQQFQSKQIRPGFDDDARMKCNLAREPRQRQARGEDHDCQQRPLEINSAPL